MFYCFFSADSEARESLEQVLIAEQRAKRLINQVVQFIRPEESKELIIDPVPVDADVLTFMRSSLPSTFDIRQNLNATRSIIIDKEQLSRVLMNLCTNAAHAMGDTGGKMEVSLVDTDLLSGKMPGFDALSQGAYVELIVQENGCGMDAETVKKIFDPYFSSPI